MDPPSRQPRHLHRSRHTAIAFFRPPGDAISRVSPAEEERVVSLVLGIAFAIVLLLGARELPRWLREQRQAQQRRITIVRAHLSSERRFKPAATLAGLALCGLVLGGGTAASARARPVVRPLYCEWIKRLSTDFLNDATNIPAAWEVHDGSVAYNRLAAFHIYAVTDSQYRPWANVTSERHFLRIRPLRLPGDGLPPGRAYYAELSGTPRYFYRPPGRRRADRPVLLSFEYECTAPTVFHYRYFLLDVKPIADPPPPSSVTIPSHYDVERFPELAAACPGLQRLGVDYLADEREGVAARDTRSGSFFPDREAAFQVYGLGNDATADSYLTVDSDRLQVKLWTPPGSPSAAGTVRFDASGDVPRLVYTPDQLSSRPRAVVLTFGYRCGLHTHRRDFLMDIPATPGASAAEDSIDPTLCCGGSK